MLRNPSSPTSWPNRLLLLLVIGLTITDSWWGRREMGLRALGLILPWTILCGCLPTIHLVLILFLDFLVPRHWPSWPDPVPFLVIKGCGVAFYLYVAILVSPLRRSLIWARAGRVTAKYALIAAGVAVLAAIGL